MRAIYLNISNALIALFTLAALTITGCGGNAVNGATAPTPTTNANLALSASPTSVKSDNSNTSTITVSALSSSNAAVPDVVVSLAVDTGTLSTGTVTTNASGQATFTFSSGTLDKANRTATITATAGTGSTQIPVQITGSTLTVTSTGSTVPNTGASPVTMTFTAKDAGGNPVSGAAVSVAASGTGSVTITPVTSPVGLTDANGQYIVTVAGGTTAGTATITGNALGATAAVQLTVSSTAATFSISKTVLTTGGVAQAATLNPTSVAMKTGDSLAVTVTAPAPTTSVTFATSIGSWTGGSNIHTVAVAGGAATATLTTNAAGLASVQVIDASPTNPIVSDTLSVAMTATTAYAVTLQASPSVISRSTGTTAGVSTLLATVTDSNGQPVGGVPVAFSILNPTGGAETISPVIAYTASTQTTTLGLGQAMATFTAGSAATSATGSQIRATVLGTAVQTEASGLNVTASGNDASVVIGGLAGSVAFGQATVLTEGLNKTTYILAMSVMVADANGNPAPQGTPVNLSLRPIAWSTGIGCAVDADTATTGTFWNEDANENLVLDTIPDEDGSRDYYATGLATVTGTKDAKITPPNSYGGTIPATVYTNASGVATFDLEYPKTSAIWIVDRIRATTTVQGSDAVGEIAFRLSPVKGDVDPVCLLGDSPFSF